MWWHIICMTNDEDAMKGHPHMHMVFSYLRFLRTLPETNPLQPFTHMLHEAKVEDVFRKNSTSPEQLVEAERQWLSREMVHGGCNMMPLLPGMQLKSVGSGPSSNQCANVARQSVTVVEVSGITKVFQIVFFPVWLSYCIISVPNLSAAWKHRGD